MHEYKAWHAPRVEVSEDEERAEVMDANQFAELLQQMQAANAQLANTLNAGGASGAEANEEQGGITYLLP